MPKILVKIICGILIVLVTMLGVSACASKPEPEYASQITESILQAMNEDDYAKYTEHFDEMMKNAVTEAVFEENNSLIKSIIGDYESKEFWKVEEEDTYTIVFYKAKFNQEPDDVIVQVVFQEIWGTIYVSGLWYDSPKLRMQ